MKLVYYFFCQAIHRLQLIRGLRGASFYWRFSYLIFFAYFHVVFSFQESEMRLCCEEF